jgi:uncharacterized protein (TIGR00369 family)
MDAFNHPNVNDLLGVEVVRASPDEVVLRVEVGPNVHQPFGILHGGVSALLAEGAASIGGFLSVAPDHIVVGTELNCSHLRSMSTGTLTAVATPFRKGRSVHVWGIELRDEQERLICVARCTLQVLPAPALE